MLVKLVMMVMMRVLIEKSDYDDDVDEADGAHGGTDGDDVRKDVTGNVYLPLFFLPPYQPYVVTSPSADPSVASLSGWHLI